MSDRNTAAIPLLSTLVSSSAAAVAAFATLATLGLAGCGANKVSIEAPDENKDTTSEQTPEGKRGPGKPGVPVGKSAVVSEFLTSKVGAYEKVQKDAAQVLLVNQKGDAAIVGVTRGNVKREPGFGGDLIFARYALGKGWDAERVVQVPVDVPAALLANTPAVVADAATGAAAVLAVTPTPLPTALVAPRGGRLTESGKALVVGELSAGTKFGQVTGFLADTATASQTVFLSVFAPKESGMTTTVRYGLSGNNTVVGAANARGEDDVLFAGRTESGLRVNANGIMSQTAVPSNYIAEVSDKGIITRHIAWPEALPEAQVIEKVRALASNANHAFAAMERAKVGDEANPKEVFVKSLRMRESSSTFGPLPEKQVCAKASEGATSVRVASIDATEKEVVVAVEIVNASVEDGMGLPCFEVFEVKPSGTLAAKREVVSLSSNQTIINTTRAVFVGGDRILLARSRENTDSRGVGAVVVTFLYERPLTDEGYASTLWSLSRPPSFAGGESVEGLRRNVQSVVWPKGSKQQDVVWILSSDVTVRADGQESLVHLGTYSAVSKHGK